MSHASKFDLITVGHFALDTIVSPKIRQPRAALGGPPTYVSVAAAKLGAKVSVISKVGKDFSDEYLEWLQKNNVDLAGLKRVLNASTTSFVLEYQNWERKLRLQARAPSIPPADIPASLSAQIIHVAPIANEIPSQTVVKLRKLTNVLSLDPQGFVRSFDKKGNVILKQWLEPDVLTKIDVFKSTVPEILAITGLQDLELAIEQIADYGIRIVLVTRGMEGSALFFDGQFYSIPACKSKLVVDPTGAGDAYIGGFLAEYALGKDVFWCASVASATASFVIEGVGSERFGEKHEVYERAQGIYEKVAGKK